MARAHVNGVELEYEITGGGEPLVFVGGTGVGGGIWHRSQVPRFCSRYTCVTFDLRGTGASDAPQSPYTVALFARDAEALLDRLGVRRAHFVGLSLGTAVIQEIALRNPMLVRSAVLLGTWSSTRREHHIRRWFEARLKTLRDAPLAVFHAYSFWMWAPSVVDREPGLVEELEAFFREHSGRQPLHAYVNHFEADLRHETLDRLDQVACPVLVVYGEEDLITLPRYNEAVARRITGARSVRISNCGHLAFIERPDPVNAAIEQFLEEVD
ncbi:MAG: alpha/beta fold hydrolase [Solirubrobacteraceae bacterium]